MRRRDFLKTAGLATAQLAAGCDTRRRQDSAERTARRRPNIVFIFIDDMGWTDVAFMARAIGLGYTETFYETPNIDGLAGQGVVFTSAYSNAPNCAPTRACLMSGQYTPRHGVYTVGSPERGRSKLRKLIPTPNTTELNTDTVTIAEALKAAGYRTACIGKWHLGAKAPYRPQDRGFDVTFERSGRGHFTADGRYLTDVLTDEALAFIESNKDRPFFLYLSHHAVHTPLQAKKELIAKYKAKEPSAGHNNPTYAAMIESVDQSVGRVIEKLDRLDLTDDTVVFFFSDNGGYGNATTMDPLRGSKGMLYEGGIRVPAIVRWPGVARRGRVCDIPIIGTDFYPTILEMTGAPRPPGYTLDGAGIVGLLKGKSILKDRAIFWHFPAYLEPYNKKQQPWRTTPAGAVRQGRYKLIEFFEDGTLELYDIQNDISEAHNLAEKKPNKTRQLHALLRTWRTAIYAPVPRKPNPDFDPQARKAKTQQ